MTYFSNNSELFQVNDGSPNNYRGHNLDFSFGNTLNRTTYHEVNKYKYRSKKLMSRVVNGDHGVYLKTLSHFGK